MGFRAILNGFRAILGGFTAVLVATASVLALALPGLAACPDDFSGSALGSQWRFVDADGTAGGSYALANGKLELTGRGRDAYGSVNEFVGVARNDIVGDFDVSVRLESQANIHDWSQAGILAATDLGDFKKGGYVVLDATPANGFNLFYDSAEPAGTLDKFVQAKPSGYPVWLRLAKSGNRFSAWYRMKAEDAWTVIATSVAPVGAQAPSQLALFSLSHDAAKDGKAVFDDFACLHTPTTLRRRAQMHRFADGVAPAFPAARDVAGRVSDGPLLRLRP